MGDPKIKNSGGCMRRLLIPGAALLLALLVVGCNNPTSSSDPTYTSAVRGTYSGVIFDGVTGRGLAGVTVEMAGKSVTTSSTGLFVIEDIPGGTYTVSFNHDGYLGVESYQVTFNPEQYKIDDPWGQMEQADLALIARNAGPMAGVDSGDPDTTDDSDVPTSTGPGDTSQWTYNEDKGTYNLNTEDGGVIEVNFNDQGEPLSAFYLAGEYEFGQSDGAFAMYPLNGGITGTLSVVYERVGNTGAQTRTEFAAQGTQVLVRVPAVQAPDGADPDNSGGSEGNTEQNRDTIDGSPVFSGTVGANGVFEVLNVPVGVNLEIIVPTFAQTDDRGTPADDSDDISYGFGDLTTARANTQGDTTFVATVDSNTSARAIEVGSIVIEPIDGDAEIIAQSNMGSINAPLAADGTFSVTFSKPINPNGFEAILDSDGNDVYDEGTDDRMLSVTWDETATQATFAPMDDPDTAADESSLPFGYSLQPRLDLVILEGTTSDGNGIAYEDGNNNGVPLVGGGFDQLRVYTQDDLELLSIEYLDGSGNVLEFDNIADIVAGNTTTAVVPNGGQVRFTFNKTLDDTVGADVEIFEDSNADADDAVTTAGDLSTPFGVSKIATPVIANDATAGTATVTVTLPDGLSFGQLYAIAISVQTNGTPVEEFVGFNDDGGNQDDLLASFEYNTALQPVAFNTNVDTNINLVTATVGTTDLTGNFGATDGSTTNVSNDFGYTDTIEIEFNQALTGQTVAMYYWEDGGDNIIQASELTELTNGTDYTVTVADSTAVAATSTVIEIDPAGYLAVGGRFALDVEATSAAGTFDLNTDEYYVLQVEATPEEFLAPTAGYSYTISDFEVNDADGPDANGDEADDYTMDGQYSDNIDSTEFDIDFDFTLLEERYGATGMYEIAFRPSGADEWAVSDPLVEVDAKTRLGRLFSSTQSITHVIGDPNSDSVGAVEVGETLYDSTGIPYNYLYGGSSIEYILYAINEKGLYAFSDVVTVSDTIPPTGSATANPLTDFNADGIADGTAGQAFLGGTFTVNGGDAAANDTFTADADGTFDITFTPSERIDDSSVTLTETFADADITATVDATDSAITVTVTYAAGDVFTSGEYVQVVFDDTSGNSVVDDLSVASPNAYLRTTIPNDE